MSEFVKTVQLFMIHYAGGNCYSYHFLRPFLKNDLLEIHMLELPGRGKRINQDLLHSREDAIDDIYKQIINRLNQEEYIIYGHSMGALLAYLVSKKLSEDQKPPKNLILTGNAGPFEKESFSNLYNLPQDELLENLRLMGGIKEEFFKHEKLLDFFIPVIRADLEIVEKDKDEIIFDNQNIPIHAIMGDAEKGHEFIDCWGQCTNCFTRSFMEGDHFFIHKHPSQLAKVIIEIAFR